MTEQKIFEIISSQKHGLYIIQLPTGFGKTHSAVESIKRYLDETKDTRQVIFVTNLKKNLPKEKELLDSKSGDIKEYIDGEITFSESDEDTDNLLKDLNVDDNIVLRLESNEEMAEKAYKNKVFNQVDKEFQTENFQNLQRIYDVLVEIEGNRKSSSFASYKSIADYKEESREKVQKLLKSWGSEIVSILYDKGEETAKAKKKIISRKYQWISKIFPAVSAGDARILLMSIDKLYWGKTVLMDNCGFITESFLKNKIIIIDEFDATKSNLRKCILNKDNRMGDYIGLFRELYNATLEEPNKRIRSCIKAVEDDAVIYKNGKGFKWSSIVDEAKRLHDYYHTGYNFQTPRQNRKNKDRNILFRDGKFKTINDKFIRMNAKGDDGIVEILPLTQQQSREGKYGVRQNLVIMLGQIGGFIKFFARFINAVALQYKKRDDEEKKALLAKGIDADMITIEQSIRTILKALHISSGQREESESNSVLERILELCMSFQMNRKKVRHKKSTPLTPYNYFNDGFSLYETIDSNNHNEDTSIKVTNVLDTPESILLNMSEVATVVGLSATATLNSVTGNYSLEFLKDELQDDYHDLIRDDDEFRLSLQEDFENHYLPYYNGQINVTTEVVDCNKTNYREQVKGLFKSEQNWQNALKAIERDSNDYNKGRYAGILTAMKRFAECNNPNVRTLLYLGNASVKEGPDARIKKEVLLNLLNLVNIECGLSEENKVQLECLNADNFETNKKNMQTKLSETKAKLFICSTYACIGAGQNLQYESNSDNLVKLPKKKNDNRDYTERDIDWIYIGDITHLTKKGTEEENLVMAEELYEHGEITVSQKELLVEAALDHTKSQSFFSAITSRCESIKAERTRTVIQAIGRLDRTNLKSNEIRIEIDQNVIENLSGNVLKSDFQSPLVETLKNEFYRRYPEEVTGERMMNTNKAELRAVKFNSYLSKMLYKNWDHWSKAEIESWQSLRETVLCHPTADDAAFAEIGCIHDYYINDEERKLNKYSFITRLGDGRFYTDLQIEMGDKPLRAREGELKLEVSAERARLDQVLNYPQMRDYFESKGYATEFEENKYIMPPTMFTNIYKGALGEVAGKFILENELGIKLIDMDQDKFEYFDFQIEGHEGLYIDFKHWRAYMNQDTEEVMQHIIDKKEKIGAKKVFIIGLLKDGETNYQFQEKASGIYTIPYLIDENGRVVVENIKKLRTLIYEY